MKLKTVRTEIKITSEGQRVHTVIKLPSDSERIVRISAWAGIAAEALPPPPDPNTFFSAVLSVTLID